jgi:ubiquinone/menaquinone biosynthesis C-methylase UbiE
MLGSMELPSRWRGWSNAEQYDRFVREREIYGWLNRQLVRRAALAGARRILDLGCGTGATARALAAAMDRDAEVVAVDASPEMVAVARSTILDPRVRFVVAGAGSIADALHGPFDRAVSNAAFWQFPEPETVLDALAALMPRGARLVFNVPSERRPDASPSHAFQLALARAIEVRSGEPYASLAPPFDPNAFRARAEATGFVEEAREELVYRGRQGELMELMGIPAMLGPAAPELSEDQAMRALREARERSDPDEPVEVPWLFLRYRRA